MKKREFVRENQKFCERKQFAQGHLTSQYQSKELNTLKINECFYSESLIRAPSSWCQEFSPGDRWNYSDLHEITHCVSEKRDSEIFRLRNPSSQGRSKSFFSIIYENVFHISTELRARQKYLSEEDENLLYSTLHLKCVILIFLLKIRVINANIHSQMSVRNLSPKASSLADHINAKSQRNCFQLVVLSGPANLLSLWSDLCPSQSLTILLSACFNS